MWSDNNFTRKIAKTVIADVAPDELTLFDELADGYFAGPGTPALPNRGDLEMGFGFESAMAITPAAVAAVASVLEYLASEVGKSAVSAGTDWVHDRVKALFTMIFAATLSGKDQRGKVEFSLTKAQLQEVKRIARDQAMKFGMKPEVSKKMAQSLVGILATR